MSKLSILSWIFSTGKSEVNAAYKGLFWGATPDNAACSFIHSFIWSLNCRVHTQWHNPSKLHVCASKSILGYYIVYNVSLNIWDSLYIWGIGSFCTVKIDYLIMQNWLAFADCVECMLDVYLLFWLPKSSQSFSLLRNVSGTKWIFCPCLPRQGYFVSIYYRVYIL
jgi:hypothetical protein